jgi:hypothetical protein
MNEIYSRKDCFKKGLMPSKFGVQISHSMEDGERMPHVNRGDLELLKRCAEPNLSFYGELNYCEMRG